METCAGMHKVSPHVVHSPKLKAHSPSYHIPHPPGRAGGTKILMAAHSQTLHMRNRFKLHTTKMVPTHVSAYNNISRESCNQLTCQTKNVLIKFQNTAAHCGHKPRNKAPSRKRESPLISLWLWVFALKSYVKILHQEYDPLISSKLWVFALKSNMKILHQEYDSQESSSKYIK